MSAVTFAAVALAGVPSAGAAAAPEEINHVILGDSYSAGNGAGGEQADPPRCYRSDNVWGKQLGRYLKKFNLKVHTENWACSGAIASDIINEDGSLDAAGVPTDYEKSEPTPRQIQSPTDGRCPTLNAGYAGPHYVNNGIWFDQCEYFLVPQLDHVTKSTNLVTLTIGGNDLGFADVIGKCLVLEHNGVGFASGLFDFKRSCDDYLNTAETRLADKGPDGIESRIRNVLTSVGERMDQKGLILLSGYPSLIGADTQPDGDVPKDFSKRMRAGQEALDVLEKALVDELNARPGAHPKYLFTSPRTDFEGRQILINFRDETVENSAAWFIAPFVDAGLKDKDLFYHPNSAGHAAWASSAAGVINEKPPTSPIGGVKRPLDVVFVVDTTASMTPTIDSVKAEATKLLNSLDGVSESWRAAVVSYRDFASRTGNSIDYPSKLILGFTNDKARVIAAVNSLNLGDGGDRAETMYSGMMTALELPWRNGVDKRLVVMTDAGALDPEPNTGYTAAQVARKALAVDPAQIIGLAVDGAGPDAQASMQRVIETAGGLVVNVGSGGTGGAIIDAITNLPRDPRAWLEGSGAAEPGQPITLDASQSADPAGGALSYEWDVNGDGRVDATTSTATLTVAFPAAFEGLASVRVVTGGGRSSTATTPLRISRRPASTLSGTSSYYQPIQPRRLLDSRTGIGAPIHRLQAGETVELPIDNPSGNAAAVLNLTVDRAAAPGWVTVHPCEQPRPVASNLNYATGDTTPNLVIAPLSASNRICLYTQAEVDLIADLNGFVPNAFGYTPIAPLRVLDSRNAIGGPTRRVPAGGTIELALPDSASGSAAMLNVTVDGPAGGGYVTVYPCGAARPVASSLNYRTGQTVANLTVATIGAGNRVCLYSSAEVDLVADLNGTLGWDSPYRALMPTRIYDSRTGTTPHRVAAGSTIELAIPAELAYDTIGGSVVLNATIVDAGGPGWATIWPCATPRPVASNLNFTTGQTGPNLAITGTAAGKACLYTTTDIDLVIDLYGSFASPERNGTGAFTIVG